LNCACTGMIVTCAQHFVNILTSADLLRSRHDPNNFNSSMRVGATNLSVLHYILVGVKTVVLAPTSNMYLRIGDPDGARRTQAIYTGSGRRMPYI
jgi:hypothetical protein